MSEGRPRRIDKSFSWVRRLSKLLLAPKDRGQLITLLRNASERHILDTEALAIVEGALNISQIEARDIMTPRSQVVMISGNASPVEILQQVTATPHSRFPVIDDDRDNVIGILLAKDLLSVVVRNGEFDFDLQALLRPVVFIPETKRLNVLLRELRTRRNHMAIVVDEYGGVSGMITIENVLEQIVGDIEDEHDVNNDDDPIQQRNESTYIIKALTMVDVFNDYFGTEWSDDDFDTVGGHVVNKFGHLPGRGEQITIDDRYEFTVLRADKRRVHLLRMVVKPDEAVSDSEAEKD